MQNTNTDLISQDAAEAFSNGRYLLGGEFDWDGARAHFEIAQSLGHPLAQAVLEWLDALEGEDPEDLANYHPQSNVPEMLMTSGFLLEDEEEFESLEDDLAARRHAEYVWLCFNHDDGARTNVLIDLFQKLESGYFPRDFLDDRCIKEALGHVENLGVPFALQLKRELGYQTEGDGSQDTEFAAPEPTNPKCPKCFQRTIPIVYGMTLPPAAGEPEFHIGGCLVDRSNPHWHCKNCGKEF